MKIKWISTLRNYQLSYLPKDILSGIIIAAVSIPIAMGYAQIAGLPPVYGLYGSIFPCIFFAIFSTSRQFIFGVDATPAALVGAALTSMGVTAGSEQAMQLVPWIALFTGIWLLLFYFLKAGRMVDYISTPVMGGFISGIALSIILMQVPKILGSGAGSGELPGLLKCIGKAALHVNWLSLGLGLGTLILIRLAGKWIPKFPMAIVMMAAGVCATCVFHVDRYGVKLLAAVQPGLPGVFHPQFSGIDFTHVAGRGLMVAVVVMAQTLLAENKFAMKNGYKIDENQEILACAAGNLASAAVGCCPVNGSIARTAMNEQYGGKTQAVSLTAAVTMLVIILGATDFIAYLPVPVLTAIVISALMNVVEGKLAIRLYKVSRNEFYIFVAAAVSVLFLGTIYGVVIGILLSFIAVVLRATNPPRSFRGIIPGKAAYYDLGRNRNAYPIRHTVIYRFSENLFFANVKIFQTDIESSIKEDTKVVIVDASAINSIDITAADRLEMIAANLKKKGIRFYITEHSANVNDQMRQLGIGHLIEEGMVRRTILAALKDAGMTEPWPLELPEGQTEYPKIMIPAEEEDSLEEFAWAFGDEAVEQIEKNVHKVMKQIETVRSLDEMDELKKAEHVMHWHSLGAIDEDEILRRIEIHLNDLSGNYKVDRQTLIHLIEKRRKNIEERIAKMHPEVLKQLKQSRERMEKRLEKQNPEALERLHEWERSIREMKNKDLDEKEDKHAEDK